DWLQHLIGDWNLLSDLLRADLVLWIQEDRAPWPWRTAAPPPAPPSTTRTRWAAPATTGRRAPRSPGCWPGESRTTGPPRSSARDAPRPGCWSPCARRAAPSPCWRRRA